MGFPECRSTVRLLASGDASLRFRVDVVPALNLRQKVLKAKLLMAKP